MKLINKLNLPLWKEGTKKKIYINSTANAQTETHKTNHPKNTVNIHYFHQKIALIRDKKKDFHQG